MKRYSKLKIYSIKDESILHLKEWGGILMSELLIEAANSLAEENCIFEEARIFYIDNKPYVIGYMVSKIDTDFIKGPESEINIKHREIIKNSILEEVHTEILYGVSNI